MRSTNASLIVAFAFGPRDGVSQTPAREQLARGKALWEQRLAKSAIAALEIAARDKDTAAEAHETLGRIYTYKGWLSDNVMPGWHDEPSLRERALAELRAAVAADPTRRSAKDALRQAEDMRRPRWSSQRRHDPRFGRWTRRCGLQIKPGAPVSEARAPDARATRRPTRRRFRRGPVRSTAANTTPRSRRPRATAASDASRRNLTPTRSREVQGAYAPRAQPVGGLHGVGALPQEGLRRRRREARRGRTAVTRRRLREPVPSRRAGAGTKRSREGARTRPECAVALGRTSSTAPACDAGVERRAGGRGRRRRVRRRLEAELGRRREARKASALKSLVDRPLPKLTLTTVDGRPYDTSGLRGKVLLWEFFASW